MDQAGPKPKQFEWAVVLLTGVQQPLVRYIRTLVPNRADAEDVLQETNLLLWRQIEEFQQGTDFTAWACKLAYYQVLTYRKRKLRSRLCFSDALVDQLAVGMAAQSDWIADDVAAFEDCVAKLSPTDRELIELRYEPGATVQSVAQLVGRSTKAVYNALGRVRTWLLECIGESVARRRKS